MYCDTSQSTELKLAGPHNKPYGVRGLGTHYHMRFDPKLGHGTYAIYRIPCSFTY